MDRIGDPLRGSQSFLATLEGIPWICHGVTAGCRIPGQGQANAAETDLRGPSSDVHGVTGSTAVLNTTIAFQEDSLTAEAEASL